MGTLANPDRGPGLGPLVNMLNLHVFKYKRCVSDVKPQKQPRGGPWCDAAEEAGMVGRWCLGVNQKMARKISIARILRWVVLRPQGSQPQQREGDVRHNARPVLFSVDFHSRSVLSAFPGDPAREFPGSREVPIV